MSTKSHIKLNDSVEIYEETSEPQSENGKWIGDNIYFLSDPEYIDSVRLNPKSGNLYVILRNPYSFWKMDLQDVLKTEYGIYGLEIAIKGGTQTAKNLILAKE